MTMMSQIAAMLGVTARDWNMSGSIYRTPLPRGNPGTVKSHQRTAAKRRSRRRAKRLNHY